MKNYSSQTYVYAGRKYTFTAFVYVNRQDGTKDGVYLVNDDVALFQYENSLNQLFLKGELVYVDKYGTIDRFLEKTMVYCDVQKIMHETSVDGDVQTEKLSESVKFQHTFLVDAMEVRERKGNQITYRMTLVSQNWLECISNVRYSNYDRQPEEIFDIVKGMLGQVDLIVHKDTFDAIKSNVKITYATQLNDNVISSIRYLLHKLYYFQSKDISMKFIVYNETMNRYQLFDVANQNYVNGTSIVMISLFKTQTESQMQKYPTQLATVTKFPKQDVFRSMFTRVVYDYDYNYKSFVDCTMSSKNFIDFKNEKPSVTEDLYEPKFYEYNSDLMYNQYSTYWNNDIDLYGDFSRQLNEDNALVTTVDADLLRKPGAYVTIDVDRDDIKIAGGEDIKKLQDIKNKYKAIEGLWFTGKVRHIISPMQQKYQQNLVLFRNFVKKYN